MQEIRPARLRQLTHEGLIGTFCPDGNYSLDIFRHVSNFTQHPHLPSLNGGAMLIAPDNPNYERDGRALIASLEGAWRMGKGRVIALLSHVSCAMQGAFGYTARDVVRDTLAADDHLTALLGLPEEVVLPMLHVDWTDKQRDAERYRTYIIKNKCRLSL